MNCQQCGREAAPEAKFCVDCGSPLVLRCPACQTPFDLGSHFCALCGRSLPDGSPTEQHKPVEMSEVSDHLDGPQQFELPTQAEQPTQVVSQFYPCPRCHQRNAVDADYCFSCGMPLQDSHSDASSLDSMEASGSYSPAGFWVRFFAFLGDTIVTAVTFIVLVFFYSFYVVASTGDESFDFMDSSLFANLPILVTLLYHTVLVAYWATTVGKRLMGLYVLRTDGSRVGFARALARHLSTGLSSLILGIGFLMIAFREDKRGLHDLICDTMVVKSRVRPF